MLSVEKVYDELYGMIEDLKRKIAAISGGGEITITPALESGIKIADYEIDDTPGVLYAPSETAGIYSSDETKIGTWGSDDLYRKTITAPIQLSNTFANILTGIISSGDNVKFYDFTIHAGDANLHNCYDTAAGVHVSLYVNELNLVGTAKVGALTEATIDLVLCYTKTPSESEAKKTRKK